MSSPRLARDRRRTASIVLSAISLSALSVLLLSVAWISLTVAGASAMIAILPMGLFWITSWVWGVLAFVALGLGLTSTRPVLPCVLAVGALLEIIVGLAVLGTP